MEVNFIQKNQRNYLWEVLIIKTRWILCIIMFTMGVGIAGYMLLNNENTKKYTYDELNSFTTNDLFEIFLDNGLIINEDLKKIFNEEELETYFKSEFNTLHKGVTTRSDKMYLELANETKKIYDKLTE